MPSQELISNNIHPIYTNEVAHETKEIPRHLDVRNEIQGKKERTANSKKDIFSGNLIERIKDQRSSQRLQKSISKASEETIKMVIYKVSV